MSYGNLLPWGLRYLDRQPRHAVGWRDSPPPVAGKRQIQSLTDRAGGILRRLGRQQVRVNIHGVFCFRGHP